jgi:FlaA1/EpsC-like NDP-sugar epimerase
MRLDEMRILGYIDDHPNLKGRILDGFRVFGSVEELPALKQRFGIHGVVITMTMLRPEQADRLNKLAEECELTLYRWRPYLQFTRIGASEVNDAPEHTSERLAGG